MAMKKVLKGILAEKRRSDEAAKNGKLEVKDNGDGFVLTPAKPLEQEFYGEANFKDGMVSLEHLAERVKSGTVREIFDVDDDVEFHVLYTVEEK